MLLSTLLALEVLMVCSMLRITHTVPVFLILVYVCGVAVYPSRSLHYHTYYYTTYVSLI